MDDDVQRRRPPREALAWAETVLGGTVTRVRAFTGGMTSAVHQLSLRAPDGSTRQAVLRRYVIPEVLGDVPDIVPREERVLRLLEPVSLPTPRFLAADPDAEVPALLMQRLPGRPTWRPGDEDWLRGLAEVLPVLHATPAEAAATRQGGSIDDAALSTATGVTAFAPYEPEAYEPPPWLRRPALWTRALELFRRPIEEPVVLIHRDYHPGNVLWRRGRVSGVVDWQAACLGAPSVDVGWCRLELLQKCGYEVATRFTALWQEIAGETYHPAAELALLVDKLGMTHAEPPPLPEVHEDLLAKALAALG